jgi:hypothetical protein
MLCSSGTPATTTTTTTPSESGTFFGLADITQLRVFGNIPKNNQFFPTGIEFQGGPCSDLGFAPAQGALVGRRGSGLSAGWERQSFYSVEIENLTGPDGSGYYSGRFALRINGAGTGPLWSPTLSNVWRSSIQLFKFNTLFETTVTLVRSGPTSTCPAANKATINIAIVPPNVVDFRTWLRSTETSVGLPPDVEAISNPAIFADHTVTAGGGIVPVTPASAVFNSTTSQLFFDVVGNQWRGAGWTLTVNPGGGYRLTGSNGAVYIGSWQAVSPSQVALFTRVSGSPTLPGIVRLACFAA